MEKIAIDVVKGVINSRKLNTDADKKRYFDKLNQSNDFNTGIILDKKYNDEYPKQDNSDIIEEAPVKPKPVRSRKSLTKLMSANDYLDTGIQRIDEIFYELKLLNLKKNPNAVSVLFRSYLDMMSYQFLKKMNGLEEIKTEDIEKLKIENDKKLTKIKTAFTKLSINIADISEEELKKSVGINDSLDRKNLVPSLKFMLAHIASSPTLITDSKLKQALQSYVRNDRNLLGHNDFNLLVHNEYYTADGEELQKIWTQLYPLFEYFVVKIKS